MFKTIGPGLKVYKKALRGFANWWKKAEDTYPRNEHALYEKRRKYCQRAGKLKGMRMALGLSRKEAHEIAEKIAHKFFHSPYRVP